MTLDEPWERREGLDQGRGVRKSVAITAAATAAFFAAAAPSATAAAAATTSFTALPATTTAPSTATATPAAAAAVAPTTAAAATATSESATATAAAFTGRTLFTRARDVDRECPTAKVLAIEHFDGAFGLLGGAELDKRESA